MNDLISRQAAIKAICEDGTWLESQGCTEITMVERKQRDADILGELPSAERKGKWINNSPVTMKCDQCGYVISDWRWNESNFCPNCGADMRGEKNE